MSSTNIHDEIDTVEEFMALLEHQRRGHALKYSVCAAGFVLTLLILLSLTGFVVFSILTGTQNAQMETASSKLFPLLGVFSALACGFFAGWMGVHDCVRSIELTLYATRQNNVRLASKLYDRVQCNAPKSGVSEFLKTLIGG